MYNLFNKEIIIMEGDIMVKELNKESFKKEVLDNKDTVLVDFWASWCGPCRMLGPIMEEVSKDAKVYKVNVDENEDLAMEYRISSIPCVIAFKDGKEKERSIGLKTKEEILKMVK